ncbi:type I methionyl aminopeptidase [Geoalkalibacter halelectricus]|uniref:Methionine aminopeptidase n=1 Tax=Geoalkalibacter halelectricus TaxID=2847045 RepID=A0ABY5ZNG7_9BACT|nr:type I methionyl aminopeptidase [Geoalkalibacter halelectricus]MDO3379858.1 type I methionyl aminopeptidase [Geoalkalibacter halelectricus]UWZ80613.1 type I methionyl aminopeptidase [Geoalkalibacter halelectricus]
MKLKSPEDIAQMRRAGLLLWQAHQVAAKMIATGTLTADIDRAVEETLIAGGGIPLFKGVPGKVPFPAATCISLNEEVVHGIPSQRTLREGDLVSLDIGVRLNGWCADAAVTYGVGEIGTEKRRLLRVTEECLARAIAALRPGVRWSKIALKMQKLAEGEGFSVVEELVGHAIGREMWEPPQVPNFFTRKMPDFKLRPGLVLAIEPMVNLGSKEVVLRPDHWTVATRDGKPSAHFEHTVALTEDGPMVLTCGPDGEGWGMG